MRKCGIIVLNKWIGLPMKNSLAYVAPQDKKIYDCDNQVAW